MRGKLIYPGVVLLLFMLNWMPVSAGGAGGVNVSDVQVCVDGVALTGQAAIPEVLNRFFRAVILRGHVGTGAPDYWSRTQIFTRGDEALHFIVQYPETTYTIGENVTVSTLSLDNSGYGGGVFAVVQDCSIIDRLLLLDAPPVIPIPTQAVRIQFAPGTSSATIHHNISENDHHSYILGAMAGQTMIVNLNSSSNQAFIEIVRADGLVLLSDAYVQNNWTGILPSSGDYYIHVISDAAPESYSLELIIPPAPDNADYVQYQQIAFNRVAFTTAIKTTLDAHDYDGLQAMMADPFNLGVWQSEGSTWSASQMRENLISELLPVTGSIEFPEIEASYVTPGVNLFHLFPRADSFIYSRGWGHDGNMEVIIVLSQQSPGDFVWDSLLIASQGFAPTNVAIAPAPIPPATCNYDWFFTPVPDECADAAPVSFDAVMQYFQGGFMIWLSETDMIFVVFTDGLSRGWIPYSDTWQEGMPESSVSDTAPAGLFEPIRGFGIVWQDGNNRQRLGWATGAEFAFQTTRQCDDQMRTYACYYDTPGGILQFRNQSLWSNWN